MLGSRWVDVVSPPSPPKSEWNDLKTNYDKAISREHESETEVNNDTTFANCPGRRLADSCHFCYFC